MQRSLNKYFPVNNGDLEPLTDQKENLQIKLNAQQKANKSYYETGVRLIELSNRAYELYEKQNVKEKQKLLKFLLSNSKMQGNTVDFVLKMPFSLIVETKKNKKWLGYLDEIRNFFMANTLRLLAA